MRRIHLCREIDPDDIQGEILFSHLLSLEEEHPSPARVREASLSFSWYGVLTQTEMAACAEPVWPVIRDGAQAVSNALCSDDRFRRRFLYLLALPLEWPPMLLASLEHVMPRDELVALLRETLLQHPGATLGKKYAAAMLKDLGVPPPYLTWTDSRLGMIDPTRAQQPTPTFVQRRTAARVRQAAKLANRNLIPWAFSLIGRMNRSQRRDLFNDHFHVWPAALAAAYRARAGIDPLRIRPSAFDSMRLCAFTQALHTIHQLERRHVFHENH